MQSEVMGKTLAIFMVIAMIATGIIMLPGSTDATGAYTVTGQLKDDVTDANVGGVKVTITNTTLSVNKNVTSLTDGKFTLSVVTRGDYNLTFEKTGYRTKTIMLYNVTFNETTKTADIGIQLLEPLPTVSGTIKELGATTVINDVEVTVKNGTSGAVIDQVMSVNGMFTVPVDTNSVNLYFKKNGYYDNNMENVAIADYGNTNVGNVYLEKIVPTPTIKVWGIIFENGTSDTLSGAIVSISAGDDKWITAVSDDVGYFEMLAYPGSFQIKGALTGYKSTLPEWFTVPTDKSIRKDLKLDKIPAETQTISGIIYETDGVTPIGGADLYLHSTDGKYVKHATSDDVTGAYTIAFYPGATFVLEVKKENYFTNASIGGITVTIANQDVELTMINNVHTLRGFVYDTVNDKPLVNATVTIYSKNYLYTQATNTLSNGYYEFMVYNASSFFLTVDSEGYQSVVKNADTIVANRYQEIGLEPSAMDEVKTTYTFVDWNTITVTRNSIVIVDNITTRFNADRKYGMGSVGLSLNNGDLSVAEVQAWANYLKAKGAEKRDTKEFLTLNNTIYNLNVTSYDVTIQGAEGPVSAHTTIYINSSYTYTLAKELETPDSSKFELGFNATYDTEYKNYVNYIILPLNPTQFEMTSNITETNNVVVTGYNDPITIDPMVHDGDLEEVTMMLQRSMNGTAMAKIMTGVHYVLNSTYDNYTVIVAKGPSGSTNTEVTFSAAESNDQIGDITKANFTWDFGDSEMGYGTTVKHNYTSAVDGELIARLVITETGGNKSYRNITVFVDSQNPVAGISAIITDTENITFASNVLTVNEDLPIIFSGVKFSDAESMDTETIEGAESYDDIKSGDRKGIIEKWYWAWGEENSFNETVTKEGSNNITHTYSNPGTYTLNMTATDVVGRESTAASWTVRVLDTSAPTAEFNIKNKDAIVVTEVIENTTYQYDASPTIDNYDDIENLTFEWTFNADGAITNYTGMIVNHTFAKVGTFNVTLTATDKAGNAGNKTTLVYVNLASRPNIIMKLGTLTFSSSPGTSGKAMTISVNISNDGQANATNIQTKFYIRNPDGTDKDIGTHTTTFLGIGNTTTASISWTPNKPGEFSIWANATCADEHSSQWWDNKIDDFSVQKVTVNQSPMVTWGLIAIGIVVVIVIFLGIRYFMKSGTKEEPTGDKRKKR
ncbi:MAG: carboxypeptidase regulatory-like domain-containing protein [Candidatus Thermoplasmatota archaeon]|nr:carboxypeptidase regulatory-like domain-containing protein [Candidatus Thermoplasmatota archaeon]